MPTQPQPPLAQFAEFPSSNSGLPDLECDVETGLLYRIGHSTPLIEEMRSEQVGDPSSLDTIVSKAAEPNDPDVVRMDRRPNGCLSTVFTYAGDTPDPDVVRLSAKHFRVK